MPVWCVLLAVLAVGDAGAPDAGAPVPAVSVHFGTEALMELRPDGAATPTSNAGTADFYIGLRPLFLLETTDGVFSLELGPIVRMLIGDLPPLAMPRRLIRAQDWDEASDFGAILRALRLGLDSDPIRLTAGAVNKESLGLGHAVFRYSNQDNADYHPSAASLAAAFGPIAGELFASDLLGARLFAGTIAWDLGRTFSSSLEVEGRYHVGVDVAADLAVAGQPRENNVPVLRALPATVLNVDGDLMFFRSSTVRLLVLLGAGGRLNAQGGFGALAGLAADFTLRQTALTVRVEGRKLSGGYRFGFFGPGYELARFSGVGFAEAPAATESLPTDAYSGFAEVRVGVGPGFSADVTAEYFSTRRFDLDATAQVELFDERLAGQARLTLTGLGVAPRTAATVGLQYRFVPSLYLWGSVGTVFFVESDSSLRRGVTGAVGLGVDFSTSRRR